MRQDGPQRSGTADDLFEHRRFVDFLPKGTVLFTNPVFFLLAIVDVRRRRVQTHRFAFVVSQHVVTNQEPSILAVMPPHTGLGLVHDAGRDGGLHAAAHGLAVIRVIKPVAPRFCRHTVLERNADVVQRRPVHVLHRPIRVHRHQSAVARSR